MSSFRFQQVNVFSSIARKGNPLAVVVGADGLSDEQMSSFANWTNLSETTFLLRPTTAQADYRVRIFTTTGELPFAGHPTLGSCHVWLAAGGSPARQDAVVQECGAGLVRIRQDEGRLAFVAPRLIRSGPLEPELLEKIARGLRLEPSAIVASQWADNGPGWTAVLLPSRSHVLSLKPDYAALSGVNLGVIGPWDKLTDGSDADFEVRAFIARSGAFEDPVTGSLNASLAQWLIGSGLAPTHYVASQGTALGRSGRVFIRQIDNDIWVGGATTTCIDGTVKF
jgi:PhzF family phenazine biosynthesis protein